MVAGALVVAEVSDADNAAGEQAGRLDVVAVADGHTHSPCVRYTKARQVYLACNVAVVVVDDM